MYYHEVKLKNKKLMMAKDRYIKYLINKELDKEYNSIENKIIRKQFLSIIWGSLLGDCHASRRIRVNGELGNTRVQFLQGGKNIPYLYHLWEIFKKYNFCNNKKPLIKEKIGKKGNMKNKIYKYTNFSSYTFKELNWIHDLWYDKNKKKILPPDYYLYKYIDNEALAIWIMDDGSKKESAGLILCTYAFSKEDVERLRNLLLKKFNISSSINKILNHNKTDYYYHIYIYSSEMNKLRDIVKNYIIKDMMHKIN